MSTDTSGNEQIKILFETTMKIKCDGLSFGAKESNGKAAEKQQASSRESKVMVKKRTKDSKHTPWSAKIADNAHSLAMGEGGEKGKKIGIERLQNNKNAEK